MDQDMIDRRLDSKTTRRSVVTTGVRLAYAAPIVAASFKLNHAGAQVDISGGLPPPDDELLVGAELLDESGVIGETEDPGSAGGDGGGTETTSPGGTGGGIGGGGTGGTGGTAPKPPVKKKPIVRRKKPTRRPNPKKK